MKKGMTQTLQLVVAAIVVLIVALVLLTIFSGGIRQVATMTEARALCGTEGATTCATAGSLPVSWSVAMWYVQAEGRTVSCLELMREVCDDPSSCGGCGFG